MKGLSKKQVEVHLKLYGGYVKNVNAIMDKVTLLKKDSEKNALALSELMRRFGFEFNGMRLHELYFEALGGKGEKELKGEALEKALAKQYGSFEKWLKEFSAMGLMRGIGWVLLTYDPKAKRFHNVWVSDHEVGQLGSLPILLAMDMWEHAFMVDYLPAQKGDYISAFFKNLSWKTVETRYQA